MTEHEMIYLAVLAVCEKQDSLCMDVEEERIRLARAIADELADWIISSSHGFKHCRYEPLSQVRPRPLRARRVRRMQTHALGLAAKAHLHLLELSADGSLQLRPLCQEQWKHFLANQQHPMPQPTDGYFPVTSVHRDDLAGLGYDTSKVDDATMTELAEKMADAYLDSGFWIDLPIIADHLEIPKKKWRYPHRFPHPPDSGLGNGRGGGAL
jgi:hypothetical protein